MSRRVALWAIRIQDALINFGLRDDQGVAKVFRALATLDRTCPEPLSVSGYMAREFGRHHRMAELIKHELATLIQREFPVAEHGLVTVSAVVLSSDLSNAKVFISHFGDGNETELTAALNDCGGQFRRAIAQVIHARSVPKLCFVYDTSIAQAEHISALLASVDKRGRESKQ